MLKVTEDAYVVTLETDRSPVDAVDQPEGVAYAKMISIPKADLLAMKRQISDGVAITIESDDADYFFHPSCIMAGVCPGESHGPIFGAISEDEVVTTVELTEAELEFVMSVVDGIEER